MTFPQRLPFPNLDELTPEQAELRQKMGPRRGGPNASKLMKLLVHFPVFGNAMGPLGARIADNSSLPKRLFEIATLRTVWLCNCEYLWSQHRLAGLKAGLTDEDLYAIASGVWDGVLTPLDQQVIRAVDELHFEHRFSDASWSEFDDVLGPDAKLDIMLTHGSYVTMSSMTNSLGVPVEDGESGFSPELLKLKEKG